ncbi:hypothetical protein [Paenibacillus sp. FSL R7-0179]|uniref:hypothetical protein n=1 Tax=Paenibacillus sp. FSL R7-0179 TaxID=2921672 RepID=UPI0030FA6076
MEQQLGMMNVTTMPSEEYIPGSEVLLRGLLKEDFGEGLRSVLWFPSMKKRKSGNLFLVHDYRFFDFMNSHRNRIWALHL